MSYNVITINREKAVIKSVTVESWVEALNTVGEHINNAREAEFGIDVKSTWEAPRYVLRNIKNLRNRVISFSMFKRPEEVGTKGAYFFTYIKKVA